METPIVSGHFAVATEIEDDSGCPHTLEHLVFMGSKKYPFKGLLDTLGNKMLSTTNAWTGTDQTVYTLVTAGWEGFQQLLPIYLDHILHPTLKDSACLTEVYHIDGNAEEKGVVFSEMQGVENQSGSLIGQEGQRLMYSAKSGYSSNTGGLMEKLRVLSNDQIKEFHKLRYRPDNLCVIITGKVDKDELLETMTKFDNELESSNGQQTPRPFVDSPRDPRLVNNVTKEIEFPEADESFGEVQISWLGPDALELIENTALHVVGSYLTMEGAGKLQMEIVEVSNPLATDISYYTDDYIDTVFHLYLSGVPTERLDEVDKAVSDVIARQITDNFDISLIRDCVERKMNKYLLNVERDPSTMAYIAIDSFIYGSRDGANLEQWTKDLNEYKVLGEWTAAQWKELITKYLVDNSRVVIKGKPSGAMFERLNQEKESRVQEYKTKFGESGLQKLQNKLETAQKENDTPIPAELLEAFSSPDMSKIDFIHTKSACAGLAKKDETHALENMDYDLQMRIDKDGGNESPLYIHFEQYDSQFIEARLYISSFAVSNPALLPLVQLVFTELFTLPMVLDDGSQLSVEEVVTQVKKDTISNSVATGGVFGEFINIKVLTKVEKYDKLVEWVSRAMWNTVFDVERLKIIIEKHLNSVPEEKRDGTNVLLSSMYDTTLTERSLKKASDMIISEEFAEDVYDELDSKQKKKVAAVVAQLEELRRSLFEPKNMLILVTGGIHHVKNPVSEWNRLIEGAEKRNLSFGGILEIPRTINALSSKGVSLNKEAYITPMSATESSYVAVVTKSPSDYRHPDIPALAVCCSYLQTVEGPFWRGIRGTGLAYGASLARFPEMGLFMLDIYRGSDPGKALSVAKEIVDDLAQGRTEFESEYVEGAISSLVNSLVSSDSNACSVAANKFCDNHLRKRGPNFTESFIAAIRKVTAEDLRRVVSKYCVPMFDTGSSMIFAACHVSLSENLKKSFTDSGYTVTVNSVVGVDDEEEDDEDEVLSETSCTSCEDEDSSDDEADKM